MIHPLFVGYFDLSVRSIRPKITRPIDLDKVRAILLIYCDKEADGTPILAELDKKMPPEPAGKWLGRIDHEDVHYKAGYLICPWLSAGSNKNSIRFICELYASLGVQIYELGDARFFTPEALSAEEC